MHIASTIFIIKTLHITHKYHRNDPKFIIHTETCRICHPPPLNYSSYLNWCPHTYDKVDVEGFSIREITKTVRYGGKPETEVMG